MQKKETEAADPLQQDRILVTVSYVDGNLRIREKGLINRETLRQILEELDR